MCGGVHENCKKHQRKNYRLIVFVLLHRLRSVVLVHRLRRSFIRLSFLASCHRLSACHSPFPFRTSHPFSYPFVLLHRLRSVVLVHRLRRYFQHHHSHGISHFGLSDRCQAPLPLSVVLLAVRHEWKCPSRSLGCGCTSRHVVQVWPKLSKVAPLQGHQCREYT